MAVPVFTAHETEGGLEYYVRVGLPNGDEAAINHFPTLPAAEGWISRECANWMAAHAERAGLKTKVKIKRQQTAAK